MTVLTTRKEIRIVCQLTILKALTFVGYFMLFTWTPAAMEVSNHASSGLSMQSSFAVNAALLLLWAASAIMAGAIADSGVGIVRTCLFGSIATGALAPISFWLMDGSSLAWRRMGRNWCTRYMPCTQ